MSDRPHPGPPEIDWEFTRRHRMAPVPGPEDWPSDVRPISSEGVGLFGLDGEGRLFWDGKPVEVRRSLTLTRGQKMVAALVVAFTILGGLGSMLQGAVAAHQWGCQSHLWSAGCQANR